MLALDRSLQFDLEDVAQGGKTSLQDQTVISRRHVDIWAYTYFD